MLLPLTDHSCPAKTQTAVSGGVLVARLFELAGRPQGVLRMLPGDAEPGAALAESPDVVMISFTGSTAVGRLVGEAAGRFGSQSSWDEFTRWQWVTSRKQAHGFPF